MSHAYLPPSSASRWLVCTASPEQEADYEEEENFYTREGTLAHRMAEQKLREFFDLPEEQGQTVLDIDPITLAVAGSVSENGNEPFDLKSMDQYTTNYADYVIGLYNQLFLEDDVDIQIETKFSLKRYVPRSFGTPDCVLYSQKHLHIVDFKYGLGLLIQAEENSQLKLYALAALEQYPEAQDVTLHIVQPRREHYDKAVYDRSELEGWGKNYVIPRAYEAYNNQGRFKAGKHCQFCKAKEKCMHRIKHFQDIMNMQNSVESYELVMLANADEIRNHLTQIEKKWKDKALSGEKVQGFKLVQSKGRRYISDEDKVAQVLKSNGFNPYTLKNLTGLEKECGRMKFNELCHDYIGRKEGGLALVPQNDRREEVNPAAMDFKKL